MKMFRYTTSRVSVSYRYLPLPKSMRSYHLELTKIKGIVLEVDYDDSSCLVKYEESDEFYPPTIEWLPFEMLTNKKEFNSLEVSNESKN